MFKHRDTTRLGYGIDIAKSRVDDLDKEVIRLATEYKGKKIAVDIGSGQSRLSVILTMMGFKVWCYDIEDHSKYFATLDEVLNLEGSVYFKQIDISNLSGSDLPKDIVIAVSQRTLHHLSYNNAKRVLQKLHSKMVNGGKLYISLTGIKSRLADGYSCADSPVCERFCEVGEIGKGIYGIGSKVCLYTKDEAQKLVEDSGYKVNSIKESNFGNIKIMASK